MLDMRIAPVRSLPDRDAFAKRLLREVRKRCKELARLEGVRMEYRSRDFFLYIEQSHDYATRVRSMLQGGGDTYFSLQRCYADYCEALPAEREAVLQGWADFMRYECLPHGLSTLKQNLRVQLMPHGLVLPHPLDTDSAQALRNRQPAYRPLAADLDICLTSTLCRYLVPERMLALLPLEMDSAIQCALDNGRSRKERYEVSNQDGVRVYHSPGFSPLAEILLDKQRRDELPPRPLVALMPAWDTLLIAAADDNAALQKMFAMAQPLLRAAGECGSDQPLLLLEDEWQSFVPPPELTAAQA
jgi:hypothetical protein